MTVISLIVWALMGLAGFVLAARMFRRPAGGAGEEAARVSIVIPARNEAHNLPRLLRSIFRFRRVFDHAARPGEDVEGWLEAGLQAGYFDQPQMARDFRRFLDCTATDWARDQHALARAIASQARVAS